MGLFIYMSYSKVYSSGNSRRNVCKEFLLRLHRFIARRGMPQQVVSDNAQQFKAARSVLKRAWRDVVTDKEVRENLLLIKVYNGNL